jgi:hypothetical protein
LVVDHDDANGHDVAAPSGRRARTSNPPSGDREASPHLM